MRKESSKLEAYVTVAEAARLLGFDNVQRIYQMCEETKRTSELDWILWHGHKVITRSSVNRVIAARAKAAKKTTKKAKASK